MKFKRLMAASLAGVMAVSSAIVFDISAGAYDSSMPFIEIDGRTQYYALSTWRVAQNINEGTDTYHFETTTGGWGDSFTEGNLTVYFFDLGKGELSDLEVTSFKVNGEEKAANLTSASTDGSTWDFIAESNAAAGTRQSIVVADADNNVDIPAESTISLDISVTYTPLSADAEGEWIDNGDGTWQITNGDTAQQLGKSINVDLPDDLDYADIGTITAKFSYKGEYANGTIGINDANSEWQQAEFASSDTLTPTITLDGAQDGAKLMIYAGWFNANTTLVFEGITVGAKAIPVESVTVTPGKAELNVGDTADLTATVAPDNADDATVTWTSSDDKVVTVDENGKITAVGAGTATVTAEAGGKQGTCEVTVKALPVDVESVTLDKTTAELVEGGTVKLTATVAPENADDPTVTWTSSDEKVATVDENGIVTAVKAGKATITATAGEKSATCEVTVTAAAIPVESVTLDKTVADLEEGDTVKLTATVTPDNADDTTVTWISSDEKVATVDENGTVTAVKAGKATITANAGGKTATCEVTVTAKIVDVEKVTLDKTTAELKEGKTVQLTATVTPDNATDKTVTWTSSDEKVATVDANGTVTAVKEGKATITAKAGAKSATCAVTVTAAKQEETGVVWSGNEVIGTDWSKSIQIPASKFDLAEGDKINITYTIGSESYHQIKIANLGDWEALASVPGMSEWGTVDLKADGTFTFAISADDAALVNKNGMVISGYDFTVKEVSVTKAEKPDTGDYKESEYDFAASTKVELVPMAKENSVLVVKAITKAEAAKYNCARILITKADGTEVVSYVETVYSSFKFVDSSNAKIIETGADGIYFVVARLDNVKSNNFTVAIDLIEAKG